MSNLANIGFGVASDLEIKQLLFYTFENGKEVPVAEGFYFLYKDTTGAEIWAQLNRDRKYCGFNPHYEGKSRQRICLSECIPLLQYSPLDGLFVGWLNPAKPQDPESGDRPISFHVPDFRQWHLAALPQDGEIQLAAFAKELFIFDDVDAYMATQENHDLKISETMFSQAQRQPNAKMSGIVKEWELRTNTESNQNYFWLLVQTSCFEIDVVADTAQIAEISIGNVIMGEFWISGKFMSELTTDNRTKKSFFQKLFNYK